MIPSAATVGLELAQRDGAIVWGALSLLASNVVLIVTGGYLAALGVSLQAHWRSLWHESPAQRVKDEGWSAPLDVDGNLLRRRPRHGLGALRGTLPCDHLECRDGDPGRSQHEEVPQP